MAGSAPTAKYTHIRENSPRATHTSVFTGIPDHRLSLADILPMSNAKPVSDAISRSVPGRGTSSTSRHRQWGMANCPCGTGLTYDECCGPFHQSVASAPTAEALMRSRFSAYARRDSAYVLRTWHRGTRPRTLDLDDGVRWVGLEVLDRTSGGPFDTTGTVRFNAHYIDDGAGGTMQEDSRFVRDNGQWVYVGPR